MSWHFSRALVRGTYAGTTAAPAPKEDVLTSEAYRRAVRGLECMRCGHPPRSQFCHTDEGKGTGIKTDSRRGWPGCRECHAAVGRHMVKAVRRAVEYLLGVMTRAAVREAGTWPKNLSEWKEET